MKFKTLLLVLSTIVTVANAQISLDYYLPKDISYNPSVPTPKQFLGHEIGNGI